LRGIFLMAEEKINSTEEQQESVQATTEKEGVVAEQNTETVEAAEKVEPQAEAQTSAEDQAKTEEVSIETLQKQLADAEKKAEQAEKKATENWEKYLRQHAELENLQKRASRDVEKARKFALEKFVSDLLPIKDSLEMGIEAAEKQDTDLLTIHEGLELTDKMLNDLLVKFNIEEINPLNEKFDPQWHEAMAAQPVPNVEDNTVVIVHQKGYHLNDRLIRPARVIVAKGGQQTVAEEAAS